MFSEEDILHWHQSATLTDLFSIKKYISSQDFNKYKKGITKCTDKSKLEGFSSLCRMMRFEKEEEEKAKRIERESKYKYCRYCNKELLLISFRYNNGIKRDFHLHHMDPCKFCYDKEKIESLKDNDWYAKKLLSNQGILNPSKEMIKTKKLTLLIKREIKKQK